MTLPSSSVRTARRAPRRGFTLLEVMATLMIISILTAIAMPTAVERLRDRRTNEFSQAITLIYRQARARALGRGGAQVVRYRSAAVAQGEFIHMEAVQPLVQGATGPAEVGNCGNLPISSCTGAQWTDPNPTTLVSPDPNTHVVQWLGQTTSAYASIFSTFLDAGTTGTLTAVALADMCFTPSGRTYYRSGGSTSWVLLTGVPEVTVSRYSGTTATGTPLGPTRTVMLVPNGAARLQL